MNYLLINHIPFGKGHAPNHFVVGDMWLEDLRAQARAWSPYGCLAVAAPCVDHIPVEVSGSFHLVEVNLQEEEFNIFPLPYYSSWKTFVQVYRAVKSQLDQACQWASIVQADYGGHPIPLGQIGWSIAEKHNKKGIWVFDGADPFPRLERYVAEESNPLKRLFKHRMVKRFESFCTQAIAEADLVFAHNASVVERFEPVWNQRCHRFNRSFVRQQMLLSNQQVDGRVQQILDKSQPLRLVIAGRQTPIKAPDHVLRAMAIALKQGVELELDIIGDGESLAPCKQLAQDLGIANRVRFLGSVPYGQPLFDLLSQAHIMVITNLTAEISRNVFLGMALGLPLILYRNSGTDDLIERSKSGVLVPSGNIEALSQSLVDAAQNRQQLPQLIRNGLKLAQAQTLERTHIHRAEIAAACGASKYA
ncbi:MAG: glycosyltransferase [Drouetiella hepatica Uher 2000/2452]|jgi:glycosyltransferase involved in cell wall biosynthesis|uniref:Glycosyltransferase n=1 Tax=Drouetiella hepatica Uher 2000/2452 TaxID=904376 RepID=A0A951UNZ2_9CYAN|nr:glycosyltransferase [Drouetiella hepatica Uher 2000/2452]